MSLIAPMIPVKKRVFQLLLLTSALTAAAQGNHTSQFSTLNSQLDYRVETQATVASGDNNPLWLNANKYGLSSLDTSNGYLRAAVGRSLDQDSLRRWGLGAKVDMAVGYGMTSTVVVQQAYGEVRWLKGLLTVGSKEQPAELKNNELSSGSQCLGINARPVPQVRLSLPDYINVPLTKGWLGLKGHFAYGRMTDDGWQKDFTHERSRHTASVLLHTKAGYLRLHKPGSPLTIEGGLEMACEFGGKIMTKNAAGEYTYYEEASTNLKSFVRAIIPGGNDHEAKYGTNQLYQGAEGNHVGAWNARISWDRPSWGVSIYGDHYFEDMSQLFHLDYDGYTSDDDWRDTHGRSRYLVYDLKDMLLGVELRLKRCNWLSNVLVEYIHTKYQSGPIYHDHTQTIPDHIGGRDSYYQHGIYTGWQHWGQVMGNPLYRSPLYNTDGQIVVEDNRFRALHVGVSGTLLTDRGSSATGGRLHYRLLGTVQKGYGSYGTPFTDPRRNLSLLAETTYALRGWAEGVSVRLGLAMDRGSLLGDNVGAQLTLVYQVP